MKYIFYLSIVALILTACSKDEPNVQQGSLAQYIQSTTDLPLQYDSLIACAASGQNGILSDNSNKETSIIFYPLPGSSDFRYFSNKQIPIDVNNFNAYIEQNVNDSGLFNGYLRKFQSDATDEIGVVTFIKNNRIYISNPISIKTANQPTAFNPSGFSIFNASSLSPSFSWNSSSQGFDKIYFQVVADAQNNLISGTYTQTQNFTFYDTSNVVLNIRDVSPAPTLSPNQEYKFVLMSVSEDNWVNTLIDQNFTTN